MKKEEIIKNLIQSSMSVFNGNVTKQGYDEIKHYDTYTVVDLNKLAKFLAKYVVKDKLVED
jgi:hypothetical protein